MDGNPENVDNYPLMKAYVQFENQTIHILAGGTIDPPTAPIRRNGDVYTLTDNIGSPADGIVVERDNIVIDGSGLTVEGAGADYGILLDERENVTIQNINIKNFYYGIVLNLSRSNSISRNNITDNGCGIWLEQSSHSNITGNTITHNYIGISLYGCYINTICHNNFIENTVHVNNTTPEYLNFWDNGCEGNFWSNYNGTDLDSDGVGDTLVPCEGMDNCPLMNVYWNPCDMNHDLKVDMKDIGKSAKAFGTRSENDLWNPHADITGPEPLVPDGTVDMRDISIIARNFMEHYP
jgi:parallel beta-helix repeat protein